MGSIRFSKWHALRNDFVILLPGEAGDTVDLSRLARYVCDRRAGVGADGMILFSDTRDAGAHVRIFNADGGEAEISGNGFRCAAGALAKDGCGGGGHIVLTGAAGSSVHDVIGVTEGTLEIVSRFPGPRFEPASLPVEVGEHDPMSFPVAAAGTTVHVSCVSVGNPHAIVLGGWDLSTWQAIGRDVERCRAFPMRVNVEFVKVLSTERIDVYVWERGVGRTESSGTGAAASFSVARKKELVGERAHVVLEGGELLVEERDDELAVTGTCAEVCRGTIEIPLELRVSENHS